VSSFDLRQIQVCYALATDGDRRYVDLAALSARAVRRIHPRAKIIVLTDDQSLRAVSSTLEPYRLSATVRSVGEYSGETGPRSRFVKTQVRQFVDGDFVYLDADAVPVASFDLLFQEKGLVSAAIDRSPKAPDGSGFPTFASPAFDCLGWSHPTRYYVNCGVVFWRDTPITRALGKLWHQNWETFFRESADFADQPAFNYSLDAAGIAPVIMHDRYNARVGLSREFARGASIYHFYANDCGIPGSAAVDDLLTKFRAGVALDLSDIDSALAHAHDGFGRE
jgi:hypothetical protein